MRYYLSSLLVRQLRDYGYDEQWGLEPTFQGYLEHLWSLMDGIKRVLKPTGTAWINLGDTYNSTGKGDNIEQSEFQNERFSKQNNNQGGSRTIKIAEANKCLLLIPHRFAIGCIDRGWIVRNDIIWAKRNGMPESVTDRFSKKHEYFFFMVKSEKYFFDLDAIRDRHLTAYLERWKNGGEVAKTTKIPEDTCENYGSPRARYKRITGGADLRNGSNPLNHNGKNPGSVSDFWDIPTKPSSEKHYASYNDSLLVKPVLAGCPEGGIIYDPFMGTGSTAEVALRSNRNFIGSEMKPEYCEIANKRLKPFLEQIKLF